jgi:transcriptional regulator with XRE-family HTH domain
MSHVRHCRCGTALARDNADALCSACQRTQHHDRAPAVPVEFWRTALMGTALASGDLGRVIRMYRFHPFHRRPLPQSVVAGWLHVSQATLSRIEHGRRHLTIDEIDSFTRALGMPLALRWSAQPEVGEDVDPLSRRSLFGAGVGAALGLGATTAPAASREIDPELVGHWMDLLRLLARHDAMHGARDALGAVRHEINLIAAHRQVARGELRVHLLRVEARWAEFASWLSHDTGDTRLRDVWAERTLELAREANDPDLVAWVLMRQSRWAGHQQDAPKAISFAAAARRTPGAGDHIRALCSLRLAQGHALAQDADACERSLAAAHEVLSRVNTSDAPDLCRLDVTPAWVLGDDARCWLRLQPRKAIPMFGEVLRLVPRERTRKRGVHQAHLAMACAAAEEPERAAAEAMKALNVAQAIQSDVIVRSLRRVDRRLAAYDVPPVAEFREALAAL